MTNEEKTIYVTRTGLPLYQTLNPAQIAEAAQPTLF